MTIAQLTKALNTNKFSTVIKNLELPPIDIDLMIYDELGEGVIKIDKKKDRITLTDPESVHPPFDNSLLNKIKRIIRNYDEQDANITFQRLSALVTPVDTPFSYKRHEFIIAMYNLESVEGIHKYERIVPEIKDVRPYNKFVFYTFLDHERFGDEAVEAYIKMWGSEKKKK